MTIPSLMVFCAQARVGAMLKVKIVEMAHLFNMAALHEWLNAASVPAVGPECVWRLKACAGLL